jgi:hypothetical protein
MSTGSHGHQARDGVTNMDGIYHSMPVEAVTANVNIATLNGRA